MMRMMRGTGRRPINLTIASDQATTYSIFSAAGSPTDAVEVTVTVNTGVVVRAALVTGSGWNIGSTIKLVNKGSICGLAGGTAIGNNGFGWGGSAVNGNLSAGTDGRQGGDAILLSYDITIDNTNGNILGGGGEGGGGGSASANPSGTAGGFNGAGGGGGAGQGYSDMSSQTPPNGGYGGNQDGGTPPTNGGAGSSSGPGTGGFGGSYFPTQTGGNGGNGGTWGQPGQAGQSATGTYTQPPGNGGPAGYAVRLNGKSVTWLGGNNPTQVKGFVA